MIGARQNREVMKVKEYLKELSLTILGVLIALLIDNYREDVRDEKIVTSYLDIVAEDLNFDIQNLSKQLKQDSAYSKKLIGKHQIKLIRHSICLYT